MTEFHAYAPGLHAGGQPDARDLARLRAAGVRSVINLRAHDEAPALDEAAITRGLGLHYTVLPVRGAEDLTDAVVERFGALLEAARGEGDVLVHCASGNRVGALVALHAHAGGTGSAAALALGRAAGLAGLEPVVAARLGVRA